MSRETSSTPRAASDCTAVQNPSSSSASESQHIQVDVPSEIEMVLNPEFTSAVCDEIKLQVSGVIRNLSVSVNEENQASESADSNTFTWENPDFLSLRMGQIIEMPAGDYLKEHFNTNVLVNIIINMTAVMNSISAEYNRLHLEISELEKELAWAKDKEGHHKETQFGSNSERRSALDPEIAARKKSESKKNKEQSKKQVETVDSETDENRKTATEKDNGQNPSAQASSTEASDSGAEKDEGQDPSVPASGSRTSDPGVEKDEGQNPSVPASGSEASDSEEDKETPFRTYRSKIRRSAGCADRITQGAIHVHVHKSLDAEEIENLENYHRLPNGKYSIVVPVSLNVVVDVEYERAQSTTTGEIVSADSAQESKLLPGSTVSREFLADMIFQRYVQGISGPRIIKNLECDGIGYSKQTLYRWTIQYGVALARPVTLRLLQLALESGLLQSDETWVKIREALARENRKNSVFWLIKTSEKLRIPPIVVVSYTGSRRTEELVKLLQGFAGKLMTDGYSGYSALLREFIDTILLVGCLNHARGKFVDYLQSLKGKREYSKLTAERRANLNVNKVLDAFGVVFKQEEETDSFPTREERLKYRQEKVRPAMDELFVLIEQYHACLNETASEYWRRALEYAIKYKDRFYAAVDDPDMPLHNSSCERVFANLGVIRSNFKQIDTIAGAETFGQWFSLCQTAKENGVNAKIYLSYLFEKLPEVLQEHNCWHWLTKPTDRDILHLEDYGDLSFLDDYMPWSDDYKTYETEYSEQMKELFLRIAGWFENDRLQSVEEIA